MSTQEMILALVDEVRSLRRRVEALEGGERATKVLWLRDGVTAPSAVAGLNGLYTDVADGDLKVVFGDGVRKTVVIDT